MVAIRKILTFLHATLAQLACCGNWTRIKLKVWKYVCLQCIKQDSSPVSYMSRMSPPHYDSGILKTESRLSNSLNQIILDYTIILLITVVGL